MSYKNSKYSYMEQNRFYNKKWNPKYQKYRNYRNKNYNYQHNNFMNSQFKDKYLDNKTFKEDKNNNYDLGQINTDSNYINKQENESLNNNPKNPSENRKLNDDLVEKDESNSNIIDIKNNKKNEFEKLKEKNFNILYKFYAENFNQNTKNIKEENEQKDEEVKINDINDIKNKCKEKGYILSKEDIVILEKMEAIKDDKIVEYYNEYMFLQENKKSIYVPHILKNKKNVLSVYLKEDKLLITDFQICPENNYIFSEILKERLDNINKGNYTNNNNYGLTTTKDNSIGMLYTTIDEEFIRQILLKAELQENSIKLGSVSLNKISPTDLKPEDINDNYIRGLTTEELILLGIYYKLGPDNIQKYPRLILYERNCFITGAPVFKNILPGYQEVDCILESYIEHTFTIEDFPLVIQKKYQIKDNDIKEVPLESKCFEIKTKKLYFFEIKNSFPKNIFEIIKRMMKNVITFKEIFIKENLIDNKKEFEIIIIYDFKKGDVPAGISKYLNLNRYYYEELDGLEIKVIYCKSIYTMYTLSAIFDKIRCLDNQYNDLDNQYNDMKIKYGEMEIRLKEMENQINEMRLKLND